MRAHRAWTTRYLVSGLAISMVLAASLDEAWAQVDFNLQSRINTFLPPITSVEVTSAPPPGFTAFKLRTTATGTTECIPITPTEHRAILKDNIKNNRAFTSAAIDSLFAACHVDGDETACKQI